MRHSGRRAPAGTEALPDRLATAIYAAVTGPDPGPIGRLAEYRTILSITLEDSDVAYTSLVLEVNEARDYLVIDDLSGGGLPEHLIDRQPAFRAEGMLGGTALSFRSRITATAADPDGRRYHRVPLPETLAWRAGRAHPRIPMPMSPGIPVRLGFGRGQGIGGGILRDISAGGFAATITLTPQAERPLPGERIDRCVIDLPSGRRLLTPIEVCHVRALPFINTLKLGARFADGARPEVAARLLYESPAALPDAH